MVTQTVTPGDLKICTSCRHISWCKVPTPEEISLYYAQRYSESHDQIALQEQGRSYYRDHAFELLQKYNAAGGAKSKPVIVDFGCAYPVFLEEAKKLDLYSEIIGVDYDEETLNAGRDLRLTMFKPDDFFEKIPIGKVDIIRFSHVLEHLIDPADIMARLYPLMAKDGLVYITQPCFPVMKTDGVVPSLMDSVYPEHLHFFNPLSMISLLREAGFIITEIAAFQKEKSVQELYRNSFDEHYARMSLTETKDLSPQSFVGLGAFPTFYGENMFVYAAKSRKKLFITAFIKVWFMKIRRKLRFCS